MGYVFILQASFPVRPSVCQYSLTLFFLLVYLSCLLFLMGVGGIAEGFLGMTVCSACYR